MSLFRPKSIALLPAVCETGSAADRTPGRGPERQGIVAESSRSAAGAWPAAKPAGSRNVDVADAWPHVVLANRCWFVMDHSGRRTLVGISTAAGR